MSTFSLGIGSRINHAQFGEGVIVQVKPEDYTITFMKHGMREIERNSTELEVIDSNDK